MVILFTDFGIGSPYQAQLKAQLWRDGVTQPIIDLHADLAAYQVQYAAYLLAAYVRQFPEHSIFLCVVDPQVGGNRRAVVVSCLQRWFVGPDNGLFQILTQHFENTKVFEITWRPKHLSTSFHGRDLFAPIAAQLSRQNKSRLQPISNLNSNTYQWSNDLEKIIYIDHYGNLFSGMRANTLSKTAKITMDEHLFSYAETFCNVPKGTGLWYENSIGLVELAINQGNAAQTYQVTIGQCISCESFFISGENNGS
jgi:S-adenosyl-L-methionine hydrolase (adenosine-forming)